MDGAGSLGITDGIKNTADFVRMLDGYFDGVRVLKSI
jgi:hypothetical protein